VSRALRSQLLALLLKHPRGLTDTEMAEALGLARLDVARRRSELVTQHLVVDTGHKHYGRNGRPAVIWQLVITEHNDIPAQTARPVTGANG
jgi:predicted ArsR family transcriptional regulator